MDKEMRNGKIYPPSCSDCIISEPLPEGVDMVDIMHGTGKKKEQEPPFEVEIIGDTIYLPYMSLAYLSGFFPPIQKASDPKYIKHVQCMGARFHVLSWTHNGATCSEKDCIVNKPFIVKFGVGRPHNVEQFYEEDPWEYVW